MIGDEIHSYAKYVRAMCDADQAINAHYLRQLMEQQMSGSLNESDTQSVNHSFDMWLPLLSGVLSPK